MKRLGAWDILIEGDTVGLIAEHITPEEGDEVVDCTGLYIFPGFVDVHVHLREPGFGYKETIRSGTLSAAHGGFTTVCSMPNLKPAPDTKEHLEEQLELIREHAVIEVLPYASITMEQQGRGQLVDFDELAPLTIGFSDDGRGVQEEHLMLRAMQEAHRVGRPIVAHCEVESESRDGYIHDGEYARLHGHKGINNESEWLEVERDIALVRETGCQLHVCHVSTKESVALIRKAREEGLPVSGETAPHYLLLTDMDLKEDGHYKMNPPLRSKADQEALIEGILDGTLSCLATDHAPHSKEEKARGLAGSAFGIVGLETAFPLMMRHFVSTGRLSLEKLIELMAVRPRELFPIAGGTAVGERADLVVMDLEAVYQIDPEEFLSMGRATPFKGWEAQGKVVRLISKGKEVYKENL